MNIKPYLTAIGLSAAVLSMPAQASFDEAYAAFKKDNFARSFSLSSQCASANDVDCIRLLAVHHILGMGTPENPQEGLRQIRRCAEMADAFCELTLGDAYYQGDGIKQDYAQAFKWYKRSADQGEAAAQFSLSNMYLQGRGVKQDELEAVRLLVLSSEQNYDKALHMMGFSWQFGAFGLKADEQTAVGYFKRAVSNGYAPSMVSLGEMYVGGRGVPQNHEEAMRLFRAAADLGDKDGQYKMGIAHELGFAGTKVDLKESVKWFRLSAEQGSARALVHMGTLMHAGKGVPQDYAGAYNMFSKAAELDHELGHFNLAQMLNQGKGVPRDARAAMRSFALAADHGNAGAMSNLGVMFYNGEGVPQNFVLSYAMHNLAASSGGVESSVKNRDIALRKLSPSEVSTGQRLTNEMYEGAKVSEVIARYLKTGK